jgi:hypothetical protein
MAAPSLSTKARATAAAKGQAMPGGRYPIRSKAELEKAIHAVGRGSGSHAAIKAHIAKRAKALGATKLLPPTYQASTRVIASGPGAARQR